MRIADLRDGKPVQFRFGRSVEYHGDVERYGEVARHYTGGPAWKNGGEWQAGTLRMEFLTKDVPKGFRRQFRKYWHAGDPAFVAINGHDMEFRADDLTSEDGGETLTFMIEDYLLEIREIPS